MSITGILSILAGITGLLMAFGVIPKQPDDPEQAALWRQKHGTTLKVLCPMLILYGIAALTGLV